MRIILTGATGLIGNRFTELMHKDLEIIPLSSSLGVDITDENSIATFLQDKEFDVVLHLAGKTDVESCENDKSSDLEKLTISENAVLNLNINDINTSNWKGIKTAFAINTVGTLNLYRIAKRQGKKFVYISTDFVFSGVDEFNTEDTVANPINWYGMTKYLGEKLIDIREDLIIRLSYPYGYKSSIKKDFIWKILDLLTNREEVGLVSDQTITPTFIDDIIEGLEFILSKNEKGIFHLTGGSFESPIQIGHKIKDLYNLNTVINSINLETLYSGKARRPFQSRMKNDKILNLGFTPKTFDEGLSLVKNL